MRNAACALRTGMGKNSGTDQGVRGPGQHPGAHRPRDARGARRRSRPQRRDDFVPGLRRAAAVPGRPVRGGGRHRRRPGRILRPDRRRPPRPRRGSAAVLPRRPARRGRLRGWGSDRRVLRPADLTPRRPVPRAQACSAGGRPTGRLRLGGDRRPACAVRLRRGAGRRVAGPGRRMGCRRPGTQRRARPERDVRCGLGGIRETRRRPRHRRTGRAEQQRRSGRGRVGGRQRGARRPRRARRQRWPRHQRRTRRGRAVRISGGPRCERGTERRGAVGAGRSVELVGPRRAVRCRRTAEPGPTAGPGVTVFRPAGGRR